MFSHCAFSRAAFDWACVSVFKRPVSERTWRHQKQRLQKYSSETFPEKMQAGKDQVPHDLMGVSERACI